MSEETKAIEAEIANARAAKAAEEAITGTAKISDIEDIVANPMKYGFEWRYEWIPQRGTGNAKVQLRDNPAPLPFMLDSELYGKCFGKQSHVDSFNGTSPQVKGQNIIRTEIEKNRKVSDTDLMRALVRSIMFAVRRAGGGGGTRTFFVDAATGKQYKSIEELKAAQAPAPIVSDMLGGQKFDTLLEKQQAEIAHMTKFGLSVDQAKKALGIG